MILKHLPLLKRFLAWTLMTLTLWIMSAGPFAQAQFTFKEISSQSDYLLLDDLKQRLKQNTFPYLDYERGKQYSFCVYGYFNQEEAEKIFGEICPDCGCPYSDPETLNDFYSQPLIKVFTVDEGMGQTQEVWDPLKRRGPFFSEEQGLSILRMAKKLKKEVPLDHRILFLGRSGFWIYQALQFLDSKLEESERHQVLQVAFSGKPNSPRLVGTEDYPSLMRSIVTPERRAYYKGYLQSRGLQFKEQSSPIVIVDYIESGESLLSFLKLFTRYYQDEGIEIPDLSVYDLGNASLPQAHPSGLQGYLRRTPRGDLEYGFDPQGDFRISYQSMRLDPRDPLLFHLVNAPDHLIPAPFYPAYRWRPEYDKERDEIRYPIALEIQSDLRKIWERELESRRKSVKI